MTSTEPTPGAPGRPARRRRTPVAEHPYADMWHRDKNTGLDPALVGDGTARPAWWVGDCGHDFVQRIDNRLTSRTRTCPACSAAARKRGATGGGHRHPDMWHAEKNTKPLAAYTVQSAHIAWWTGDCGHDFQQGINIRNRSRTRLCPPCSGGLTPRVDVRAHRPVAPDQEPRP